MGKIMTTRELVNTAEKNQISVEYCRLNTAPSFAIEIGGKKYIALDGTLDSIHEREALAHELGHHVYAGLYTELAPLDTVSRVEYRAKKWAIVKLLPPKKLKAAVRECRSIYELSEYCGLSEEFVSSAVHYYLNCVGL